MNFEEGRLINLRLADLGASPQTKQATQEPVLIVQAVVTGGTLKVTVSNDNFVADNRIVCDINGATDTKMDWPLFFVAKSERVKCEWTGTKAFIRTRGLLP